MRICSATSLCGDSLFVWSETIFSAEQQLNPRLSNQKKTYILSKIEIQRGHIVPIAGATIETTKSTCRFHNTICALDFTKGGNGIEVADFEGNHLPRDKNFLLYGSPTFLVSSTLCPVVDEKLQCSKKIEMKVNDSVLHVQSHSIISA